MTDNLQIRIHVNKTENKIRFKIKAEYYMKLLSPKIMKLLRSTKSMINKNENGGTHLEITEVLFSSLPYHHYL